MNSMLRFYATPGALTHVGPHSMQVEALPHDVRSLSEAIQGLAVYDVVAKDFYGVEIDEERTQLIHLRSAEDMLTALHKIDDAPLTEQRPPERRLVSRCGGFARLMVAVLRAHGVPARSRCGFAAYLNSESYEDHWTAEVWDSAQCRWRIVDAQLDDVWRHRLNIDDDVNDLSRERFIVAADAWQRCRNRKADPQKFGISLARLYGLQFIAGSLVRDLAALNKWEIAPWDLWGAQPAPGETLSQNQLEFFDQLAELMVDPDAKFDELRNRYTTDAQLRVPARVSNALRERSEQVVPEVT